MWTYNSYNSHVFLSLTRWLVNLNDYGLCLLTNIPPVLGHIKAVRIMNSTLNAYSVTEFACFSIRLENELGMFQKQYILRYLN